MSRLLQEKEETHMLNFTVDSPGLQDHLEWVAQPPPMLASDPPDPNSPKLLDPANTHALRFLLQEISQPSDVPPLQYHGFLFFRPGNPRAFTGHDQPALMGIGNFLMQVANCQYRLRRSFSDGSPLGLPDRTADHNFVRVQLKFRPPSVFGALFFEGEQTRQVELQKVEVDHHTGSMHLVTGEPHGRWSLDMDKRTVLSPI
jgi:hypothetical protein